MRIAGMRWCIGSDHAYWWPALGFAPGMASLTPQWLTVTDLEVLVRSDLSPINARTYDGCLAAGGGPQGIRGIG